jgi:hypothetical protein
MMSTAPPLYVTHEQAARLLGYVQSYRHSTLTTLLPSTERNLTLRGLQLLQGRLIEALDQKVTPLQLVLSREDLALLKTTVNDLLALYGKQPESVERTAIINDLAALKVSLRGFSRGEAAG